MSRIQTAALWSLTLGALGLAAMNSVQLQKLKTEKQIGAAGTITVNADLDIDSVRKAIGQAHYTLSKDSLHAKDGFRYEYDVHKDGRMTQYKLSLSCLSSSCEQLLEIYTWDTRNDLPIGMRSQVCITDEDMDGLPDRISLHDIANNSSVIISKSTVNGFLSSKTEWAVQGTTAPIADSIRILYSSLYVQFNHDHDIARRIREYSAQMNIIQDYQNPNQQKSP